MLGLAGSQRGCGAGAVLLLQAGLQLAEHSKVCASFPGKKTNSNDPTATFSVILSLGAEIRTFLFLGRELHHYKLTFSGHHEK